MESHGYQQQHPHALLQRCFRSSLELPAQRAIFVGPYRRPDLSDGLMVLFLDEIEVTVALLIAFALGNLCNHPVQVGECVADCGPD